MKNKELIEAMAHPPPGFRPDGTCLITPPGEPLPETMIVMPDGSVIPESEYPGNDETEVEETNEEDGDDLSDLDDLDELLAMKEKTE